MYRIAIRLAPQTIDPSAYKNLGVLLDDQHLDPEEVISLLRHYLQLEPDDPQANEIKQRIVSLGGVAP
jgi:hypothetical protein